MAIYPGGLHVLWPTKKVWKNYYFCQNQAINSLNSVAVYPGGLRFWGRLRSYGKIILYPKILAITEYVVWQYTWWVTRLMPN